MDAEDAREAASVVKVVVFNSETTLVTEYTANGKSLTRDHHHRTYSAYTLLVYTEFKKKKKTSFVRSRFRGQRSSGDSNIQRQGLIYWP